MTVLISAKTQTRTMTKETIIERKDGVSLHIELKRETDTRDQDKISATVHAEDLNELEAKRAEMLSQLQDTANRTREILTEEIDD